VGWNRYWVFILVREFEALTPLLEELEKEPPKVNKTPEMPVFVRAARTGARRCLPKSSGSALILLTLPGGGAEPPPGFLSYKPCVQQHFSHL
jgi:hypothetical protein